MSGKVQTECLFLKIEAMEEDDAMEVTHSSYRLFMLHSPKDSVRITKLLVSTQWK